ncbi:hypothetical protein FRC09_018137 [Ceratobasidium sp. 395]|nr:hypothetical protein FRC09_018137 [Ceratobasidium sp. 395]
MGVPNTILPAEWDTKPNASGARAAFEEAARKARYKALWRGTWGQSEDDDKSTQTLMFAHHADDQLETVIMRTMRGTGLYGMGGMRAVRRWGMGEEGLKGMRTWICRPLLGVSKNADRSAYWLRAMPMTSPTNKMLLILCLTSPFVTLYDMLYPSLSMFPKTKGFSMPLSM